MQKMAKLHVLNNNREIEGQKEQKKIIKTQVYIYIYIYITGNPIINIKQSAYIFIYINERRIKKA